MEHSEEKLYQVAVGLIPGIGSMLTRQLVTYCGSSREIFKKSKKSLTNIPNIGEVVAASILQSDVLRLAEAELNMADKTGVDILFYTDASYPNRLKNIADAPTLLYKKGPIDLNPVKTVSIVGTREATAYGKDLTDKIVQELIRYEPTIVSGLAYGIDIAAHKSALKHGLPTVGVMASGIDIVYPPAHQSTAFEMIEKGAILTENKFGTIPDAPRFPARNRIIAGLADVLIVVEASTKGGALITAEIANSYNKEIFAVPGKVTDTYSLGCNKLIAAQKAHIFTSTAELVEFIGWNDVVGKSKKNNVPTVRNIPTDEQQLKLFEIIAPMGEMELDEIAWKSQWNVNKVSSILLNMEFEGFIKPLPGKKFKLIG